MNTQSEHTTLSPLEIVKETIEYYSSDPARRAKNDKGCFYNEDGKQCAVGRCFIPELNHNLSCSFASLSYDSGEHLSHGERQALFQPQYRGQPNELWMNLQDFHDLNKYWTKTGLSEFGKQEAQRLLEKWA